MGLPVLRRSLGFYLEVVIDSNSGLYSPLSCIYCITVIFLVVLYGYETWSLTLREERRLRVLRRVFGPKRENVTGEWRKLHNEELNDLYFFPSIVRVVKSRRMRWGACGMYGGGEWCAQGVGGET
jgi:hypothetical protein